ncbi:hypothetical protein [Vibrio hepatarius]|uniref:hypothetical protein n=1 Tax=Vibrio hepatarius TaxID=171383 RepID=UPI003735CD19
MKKISFLAAAITLALSGCGSDDSNHSNPTPTNPTPTIPIPVPLPEIVTNIFIDSAVEGMYYTTSSGISGLTGTEGQFTAANSDTMTFYIGGESGLKVGAASNRDVLTPFEAAGKYDRALNLAILLQSLDNQFGSSGDDTLTIPNKLQSPSEATLALLKDLSLDDRTSVITFLTAIGVDNKFITTEDQALAHMDDSFGTDSNLVRGSDKANPFVKKDGSYIRSITVRQYDIDDPVNAPQAKTLLVHADKMLPTAVFENTRGMPYFTFQDTANGLVIVNDSDTSYSGTDAEGLIYCELEDSRNYGDGCENSSDPLFKLSAGSGPFSYLLLDKSKENNTPTSEDYGWEPFIENGTQQDLNHYTPTVLIDDRNAGAANPAYQYETHSGSYDPVTGIYTQIRTKTELTDPTNENSAASRIEESLDFYYHVNSPSDEKYVDFQGTWKETQICDDGSNVAELTFVFDGSGLTMSGTECNGSNLETITGEVHTYSDLATIDYWWFNQTGRESKATLTELNSVTRFCDQDNYIAGNPCSAEYFIKWEYQPAGANWDEGLLIRRKMDNTGNTNGTSIMQKIKTKLNKVN